MIVEMNADIVKKDLFEELKYAGNFIEANFDLTALEKLLGQYDEAEELFSVISYYNYNLDNAKARLSHSKAKLASEEVSVYGESYAAAFAGLQGFIKDVDPSQLSLEDRSRMNSSILVLHDRLKELVGFEYSHRARIAKVNELSEAVFGKEHKEFDESIFYKLMDDIVCNLGVDVDAIKNKTVDLQNLISLQADFNKILSGNRSDLTRQLRKNMQTVSTLIGYVAEKEIVLDEINDRNDDLYVLFDNLVSISDVVDFKTKVHKKNNRNCFACVQEDIKAVLGKSRYGALGSFAFYDIQAHRSYVLTEIRDTAKSIVSAYK